MKKYIYSLAAFLVTFLSACTNDDIEIETITVEPTGNLTVSVSTQSVYDDFGVADEFKSRFLSGSYNIGLYTFVYDEAGNLAASDSVYVQTFGKVSQEFKNLKEGEYTSITLEMLVDADHDYQSDNWVIVGKDKLSTLEIVNKDYFAWWYSAVGVATQKLQIKANEHNSVSVTPKGIGSKVRVYMTNFDKSEYKRILFYTKDNPVGRYLDPNLSGDERFHYNSYTGENIVTSRGYVQDASSLESMSLYVLEEGRINCGFGARKVDANGNLLKFTPYPDGNYYFTFEDGKTYYGGFHYIGNDECDAGMFASFEEYTNWYEPMKPFQLPDLYTSWSASVSTVQSHMRGLTGYSLMKGTSGKAIYVSDNVYEIAYTSGNDNVISYSFTSETTGLFEADFLCPKSKVTQAAILRCLNENYQFMESLDETYMYVTSDYMTIVMLFPHPNDNSLWVVGFLDVNYISQSPVLVRNKALMSKAMSLQKQ